LTGQYIPTHNTVCLLGAIAALKQPTLVIVHTEALRKQWSGVVSKWFGFIPGRIGGGKEIIRPITIGMQQTIWRLDKERPDWVEQFGCIAIDECHHVASKTFMITANMFRSAYRIGASADEKRKDGLEFLIYDTLGPCVHEIKRDHLVSIDRLLPVDMLLVKTEYEDDHYLRNKMEGFTSDWNRLLNNLTQDEHRNELILDTVLRILKDPKSRVLILSERVQACVEWKKLFDSRGHPCGLMIGGTHNKDEVSDAIAWLKTGRIRVAAGTKIADEGLDIPQLTHVVITCPLHTHPQRLEQMTGRCARVSEGKDSATAVYFWDEKMFPAPSAEEDDDIFKKRGRARRFFSSLKKACSTMRLLDPRTGQESPIDLMKICR
jgi:superfamily II DNA or RNA helicase